MKTLRHMSRLEAMRDEETESDYLLRKAHVDHAFNLKSSTTVISELIDLLDSPQHNKALLEQIRIQMYLCEIMLDSGKLNPSRVEMLVETIVRTTVLTLLMKNGTCCLT